MPQCSQCTQTFDVTKADRALLDRIAPELNGQLYTLPDPTLCPPCRQQRRLAFYNRRTLHKRDCDLTKQPIISIYAADAPFIVYDTEEWFSDKWDPLDFGRTFDFSRPFFEQFQELMITVPLPATTLIGGDVNVNSVYNNDNYKLKNCYLTFDGTGGEDCYYGEGMISVENCMDFLYIENSQRCYECTNVYGSYGLYFSRFCNNCQDSWFLKDCIGCHHCFGCCNLQKQEYCIFNKSVGKAEYEKFMAGFDSGSFKAVTEMQAKAEEFFLTQPVKALRTLQNEESSGDNLSNSKNAHHCFDSNNLQDCRYVTNNGEGGKDLIDLDVWGADAELCYNNCVVGDNVQRVIGGFYVSEGCSDIYYSLFCSRSCKNLLGCIGLRHQQHCIFNKQYSADEYAKLAGKIIAHMRETGEWGQFYPPDISPFGYNETVAQNFYPLQKEQVLERGWHWRPLETNLGKVSKVLSSSLLPDHINDIPDDVLNWALECSNTSRAYKLIKQELDFYREHQLPVSRLHSDERHRQRTLLRNPHHIWQRQCQKCQQPTLTTYQEGRPERIFCEDCYRKEVY